MPQWPVPMECGRSALIVRTVETGLVHAALHMLSLGPTLSRCLRALPDFHLYLAARDYEGAAAMSM